MFVSLEVRYSLPQSIHCPRRIEPRVSASADRTTTSRQRRANSSRPKSSISRFELRPSSRSTPTSIQRPWQSKPFWYRWSKPRRALYRWKTSFSVRPQAVCTPSENLFAVTGPSMKEKVGPPRFCSRSFANVPSASQRASISPSSPGWSGLSGRGWKIGSRIGKASLGRGVPTFGKLGRTPLHSHVTPKGNDDKRRNRLHLRDRGPAGGQARPRGLLGRVVRAVSRGRARAGAHRRRARPQARQGEHRREPGSRDAVRDPVDPEHDALRGRRPEGFGRRRDAKGHARAPARLRKLRERGFSPCSLHL